MIERVFSGDKYFLWIKTVIQKDAVMNQCIRLVESLAAFSKTRPVNEVKQAMIAIVSVLGNLRMVRFRYITKS